MKPVQLPASMFVSARLTCWIDFPKQIGVHAQVRVRKRKRWQGLWLARDDTSGIIILTAGPNHLDSATVRYLHSVAFPCFRLAFSSADARKSTSPNSISRTSAMRSSVSIEGCRSPRSKRLTVDWCTPHRSANFDPLNPRLSRSSRRICITRLHWAFTRSVLGIS